MRYVSRQIAIKGEPDDDGTDHVMECPVCGKRFDMRDLFEHMHEGPEMPAVELPTKKPPPPEGSGG
jgi:hypothetical protein